MQQNSSLPDAQSATDLVLSVAIGGAISMGGAAAPAIIVLGCAALVVRHFPQLCSPVATGLWFAGRAVGDDTPLTVAPDGFVAAVAPALALAFSEDRATEIWPNARKQLAAPRGEVQSSAQIDEQPRREVLRTSSNETAESLLDLCCKAPHLLVFGRSNAGKTTFMHRLARIWSHANAQVIVFDPHNTPKKWPGATQVIGGGRKYDEIMAALVAADAELTRRVQELNDGITEEECFDQMVLLCDEWLSIKDHCPDAKNIMRSIIAEGRKVNMRFVVGTQSKNVEAMGIDSNIRECMITVHLVLDKITSERVALIEHKRYDVPTPVPGGTDQKPNVPAHSHSKKSLAFHTERSNEAASDELEDIEPEQREMILALSAAGWTRDKIANKLGIRRSQALKMVRLVLENTTAYSPKE